VDILAAHSTIPAAWEGSEVYRIFVDAVAMFYDSTVFNVEHPLVKLTVTSSARGFIAHQASQGDGVAKALLESLDQAINQRRIEYMSVDFTNSGRTPGIYAPYADLLAHVIFARETYPEDEVRLLISVGQIEQYAKQLGIQVITNQGLKTLVQELKEKDAAREIEEAQRQARQNRQELIKGLVGLALGFGAFIVVYNLELIISTITIWGIVALVVVAGPALYALRGRMRLAYAVAEVTVGYITASGAFFGKNVNTDRGKQVLALLGGVYIIVRGLDNVGKAVQGTAFEKRWNRYSGEKKTP